MAAPATQKSSEGKRFFCRKQRNPHPWLGNAEEKPPSLAIPCPHPSYLGSQRNSRAQPCSWSSCGCSTAGTGVKDEAPAGTVPKKAPQNASTVFFLLFFPSSCCLLVWHKLFLSWTDNNLAGATHWMCISQAGMALGMRSFIPALFPLLCCQEKNPSLLRF